MFPALPYLLADRYQLTRQLGSGNFAETYLASDTLRDRQVAVKVLREHYARDPRDAKRFEREARAAAAVGHPNVVAIFDEGRDGNARFIVMEYVEGCDLKPFIREQAPLPVGEAIQLMRQLLEGLAAIHQVGVVHRDVKPQNVLLTGDGMVKLSDFGIARGATDTRLTETGVAIGTAAYMAPEQATGADSGPAADLYAAGVILFELVTGQVPFPGDNPVQVMYQQVHEPPPRPRNITQDIPADLEQVILRALEKDPNQRFASATEMASALEAVSSVVGASTKVPTRRATVQVEHMVEAAAGFAALAGTGSNRHHRPAGRMRRPHQVDKRAQHANRVLPLVTGLVLIIAMVASVDLSGRESADEDFVVAVDPSPSGTPERDNQSAAVRSRAEPAAAPDYPSEEQESTGTSSGDRPAERNRTEPESTDTEKEREQAEKEAEMQRDRAEKQAEMQRKRIENDKTVVDD